MASVGEANPMANLSMIHIKDFYAAVTEILDLIFAIEYLKVFYC